MIEELISFIQKPAGDYLGHCTPVCGIVILQYSKENNIIFDKLQMLGCEFHIYKKCSSNKNGTNEYISFKILLICFLSITSNFTESTKKIL